MIGSAYSRILAILRDEVSESSGQAESGAAGLGAQPARMRLGTVRQQQPVRVRVMGLDLPTEVFRINEHLTVGAELSGGIPAQHMKIDLEAGDQVLLLTEDDQMFYIVMKVVMAV